MKIIPIPKNIHEDIEKCPFCNRDISVIEILVDKSNRTIWSIHCDCGILPDGFYRCNPKQDELPLLLHSWNVKIVPYIKHIVYDDDVTLPTCPQCNSETVLLPVYDKRFKGYKIRPICIDNKCRLPNQWSVVPSEMFEDIDVTEDIKQAGDYYVG